MSFSLTDGLQRAARTEQQWILSSSVGMHGYVRYLQVCQSEAAQTGVLLVGVRHQRYWD